MEGDHPVDIALGEALQLRPWTALTSRDPRPPRPGPPRASSPALSIGPRCGPAVRQRRTPLRAQPRATECRPDLPRQPGLGARSAPTAAPRRPDPKHRQHRRQGIRLDNFNVEFSCTVSRAALLTGRYAIRSGAAQNTGSPSGKRPSPKHSRAPATPRRSSKWHSVAGIGSTIGRPSTRGSITGMASRTRATRRSGPPPPSSIPIRQTPRTSGNRMPVRHHAR
ncbi:MAG: sulfatase-like hydrolase/transferase [Gemmatimonadetes bacterium]|nr:sulfatase-like hydrolase/transferase [Gemmatimonadota bacterium]